MKSNLVYNKHASYTFYVLVEVTIINIFKCQQT